MKKRPARRRRKRKTDWLMVIFSVSTLIIVATGITITVLLAQLKIVKSERNLYEQQVKVALTLYEQTRLNQNSLIIDCQTVNCMEQLTATGFIQIVVNGGK